MQPDSYIQTRMCIKFFKHVILHDIIATPTQKLIFTALPANFFTSPLFHNINANSCKSTAWKHISVLKTISWNGHTEVNATSWNSFYLTQNRRTSCTHVLCSASQQFANCLSSLCVNLSWWGACTRPRDWGDCRGSCLSSSTSLKSSQNFLCVNWSCMLIWWQMLSVKQECICNHDIYEMEEDIYFLVLMDCLIVPNELIHDHNTHVLVVIQDRRWYWYCCLNYSPASVFHSAFNNSPVESQGNTHHFCVSLQQDHYLETNTLHLVE